MEPEQVRNIMDSMIRKLYDMELEEQGRSDWQNGSIAEEGKRYLKEHFLLDISEYDSGRPVCRDCPAVYHGS